MFPGNPNVLLSCSPTPAGLRRLAFAALECCPRLSNNEDSSDAVIFEALSHDFGTGCLTLRAAITERLRKTRFRGWPTFPGGIIVHPLSS
jgi:hypothetical protein